MPGTVDVGNHGDDTVTPVTLPFPFTLYDQTFTTINLSSNGNAQFTTSATDFTNQCLPWLTHNYTIYPYWDDLYLVNSGFGIFTSISGTAPNRIFNIEWRAQYFPGTTSANFELRFVRRTDSLRYHLRHGDQRQYIGHSRSAEERYRLYPVFLQRRRWRGYWRAKLHPGSMSNPDTYTYSYGGNANTYADLRPCRLAIGSAPASGPLCHPGRPRHGQHALYRRRPDRGRVPTVYDQVSRYNYTTNSWSNVAPLPVALSQAATGAANGKIYVAGGFIGGTSVTNALRIYDIATNTWTSWRDYANYSRRRSSGGGGGQRQVLRHGRRRLQQRPEHQLHLRHRHQHLDYGGDAARHPHQHLWYGR